MRFFNRNSFLLALIVCSTFPASSYAAWQDSFSLLQQGNLSLQIGDVETHQGRDQFVDIDGLIGDRFTVTKHDDNNAVLGAAYYLPSMPIRNIDVRYGLSVFYLVDTEVKGNVIQEDIFENLAYRYKVMNFPIYFSAKTAFDTSVDWLGVNLDAGIGPNVIYARKFKETSLDGITLPDDAYHSNATADFSATIGAGLVFKNALGCNIPLEIDYRFFYLGEGHLAKSTSQINQDLRTGHSYANALIVSFTVL